MSVPPPRLPGLVADSANGHDQLVRFTLLVARSDAESPCPEFDQWGNAFYSANPTAQPVVAGTGNLTATTGGDRAVVSMYSSAIHYPSRHNDNPNPYVEGALKGKLALLMLHVPHELIEVGNPEPIAEILCDMVSSREKALASRQRVNVLVDGFDHDPRAVK